jgi:hypothetical protein
MFPKQAEAAPAQPRLIDSPDFEGDISEVPQLYSEVGRPSIAHERLLRSLLWQIFYSRQCFASFQFRG